MNRAAKKLLRDRGLRVGRSRVSSRNATPLFLQLIDVSSTADEGSWRKARKGEKL